MRHAYALAAALALLAAACGATSNAPPSTEDAGGDVAPADGGCDFTREYAYDGGCVPGTADNCNGMRCARGQSCAIVGTDQSVRVLCVSD